MKMRRLGLMGLAVVGALGIAAQVRGEFSLAAYVDEGTVAVGRVELGKVDTAGIEKYLMETMAADQTIARGLMMGKMGADVFLNGVKERGVSAVYAVLNQADAWPGRGPVAMLMPVAEGKDPKEVVEFLSHYTGEAGAPGASEDFVVEALGEHVVYWGQRAGLKRLKGVKAVSRPELELPRSDAGIVVVWAGNGEIKRVIEEMMPRFPRELPGVGGASTDFATKGFEKVVVEMGLPGSEGGPLLTVRGVFRTGEDAAECQRLARESLKAWEGSSEHAEAMKSPAGGALGKLEERVMGELSGPVSPANEVVLKLDAGTFKEMIKAMAPGLDQAKEQARRVEGMSDLRQIALGCILYTQDHKNGWPGSLEELKGYIKKDAVFVNPRDAAGGKFVLHPWTGEQIAKLMRTHASETPIAYEDPAGAQEGACVAFLDGHVEYRKNKRDVKEMIEKAEGWVK